MFTGTICCPQSNEAMYCAGKYLSSLGLRVCAQPEASAEHLLLSVPVDTNALSVLTELSDTVCVSGGNLDIPQLQKYKTVDFLQDPYYLAENAAITAECALQIVENKIEPRHAPVLIIGWGRIGKCLGFLLKNRGADVSIAARKETDLAMIRALDFRSVPVSQVNDEMTHYRVILNTVPEMILPAPNCPDSCILIELASRPGIGGSNIISARALPRKMAPVRSGKLIAETFIRLSL